LLCVIGLVVSYFHSSIFEHRELVINHQQHTRFAAAPFTSTKIENRWFDSDF
jgi:hypothetical protein